MFYLKKFLYLEFLLYHFELLLPQNAAVARRRSTKQVFLKILQN